MLATCSMVPQSLLPVISLTYGQGADKVEPGYWGTIEMSLLKVNLKFAMDRL